MKQEERALCPLLQCHRCDEARVSKVVDLLIRGSGLKARWNRWRLKRSILGAIVKAAPDELLLGEKEVSRITVRMEDDDGQQTVLTFE